ncbi:MAG: MurT ligase domain-containing protein [Atopobium sp.]|uniref:MurT ligase domain-containing protein n=1 Tax=Atopobium sp. TaxID=1872650 RepID=UPI002A81FBAE|nr:MurT ligase domain-containing protein [Atopobium sp.]MDY4523214.1 MurT ligase domain-containing protein [Atopobium sp.]
MNIRTKAAVAAGRFVSWGLRNVAHRNASQLPGRVALSLAPQVIAGLSTKLTEGSIVVCGTNGKTTTNNVVASAIEATGKRVLCNRAGANMAAGVAAALLPKATANWAVLEADELSTVHILPQLQPAYLVLLNLFRDQLDRAGEIDHIQDVLVQALISSPQTTLIACGDDPLSMGVALRAQQKGVRVLAFGIGEDLHIPQDRVPEAKFCQVCGEELQYSYRSYAQLGNFACPQGDFARPQLDFVATNVHADRDGICFTVTTPLGDSHDIHARFGGVYMVYNLLAAFAAASFAGVDAPTFQKTLDAYHPQNGRLQHFMVDGREVTLNLAKNPTGFNQNLSLLAADERNKHVFIAINDNFNDGKDISWIWDVDFERLAQAHCSTIYCSGTRAHDVQVRLKYAGIQAYLATNVQDFMHGIATASSQQPAYVLTNYSALWPAKAELESMGERI